ncbi:MAG: hypothetical protein K2Y39_14115 [Candidatus Obscuribacterales bacterium]|nr:hypothetical protein [Candidatus Obscuribacterales bacterium]
MSDEALDKVLCTLSAEKVVRFFHDMPEKERKKLATRALKWLDLSSIHNGTDWELRAFQRQSRFNSQRETEGLEPPKGVLNRLQQWEAAKVAAETMPPQAVMNKAVPIAEIAVLATAGLSDIKKRFVYSNAAHCFAVMSSRRPSWLHNWLDWITEQLPYSHWEVARRFEQETDIEVEHNSNYFTGMALTLPGSEPPPPATWVNGKTVQLPPSEGTVCEKLLADPEIIPLVWNMLADDQAMRNILHEDSRPEFRNPRNRDLQVLRWRLTSCAAMRWAVGLEQLSRQGRIDRMQLLKSVMSLFANHCLEHSDSGSTLRVDWFTGLHDKLEPTADERLSLIDHYLRLLSCRNPKVVAWALQQLLRLLKCKEFPAERVCENISLTFLLKGREHCTLALKTLNTIAENHPGIKRHVAAAAIEAMENESQDIQKRALTLLGKLKVKDTELVGRMQSKLNRIAVIHRAEAAKWAGELEAVPMSCEPNPANVVWLKNEKPISRTAEDRSDLAKFRERCASIPDDLRALAKIDVALAALDNDELEVAPLCFRGDEIPRLNPEKKQQRIESIDDLIFTLLRMLNSPWNQYGADELETVLDAFARLGAERADDFETKTQVLAKKAVATMHESVLNPVIIACAAWTRGEDPSGWLAGIIGRWRHASPVDDFLRERFCDVCEAFGQGKQFELLSTPTHQGGWIDPIVLVERIKRGNSINDFCDQSLALLRLAPDNRAAALSDLAGVQRTEFIDALSYALGAENVSIGKTVELWIAAGRARNPFNHDEKIGSLFPDYGPDAAFLSQYRLKFTTEAPTDWAKGLEKFRMLERSPAVPLRTKNADVMYVPSNVREDNLITVHMHRTRYQDWFFSPLQDWHRSITPLNLDSFFAEGIEKIARHDGHKFTGQSNRVYLKALYDPDVPMTRLAQIMLVLGLASKQTEEHATAIEALIAAIDDGRLNGTEIGGIMYELFSPNAYRSNTFFNAPFVPLISLTRWAKAIAPVVQASMYHAHAIARCIEEFCQGDPANAPKDIHQLLEILLSCLVETGDSIRSDRMRSFLNELGKDKGSSKTMKLIKQLLALGKGPNYASKRRDALIHVLEKRMERAERWYAWRQKSCTV